MAAENCERDKMAAENTFIELQLKKKVYDLEGKGP